MGGSQAGLGWACESQGAKHAVAPVHASAHNRASTRTVHPQHRQPRLGGSSASLLHLAPLVPTETHAVHAMHCVCEPPPTTPPAEPTAPTPTPAPTPAPAPTATPYTPQRSVYVSDPALGYGSKGILELPGDTPFELKVEVLDVFPVAK